MYVQIKYEDVGAKGFGGPKLLLFEAGVDVKLWCRF